MSDFLLIHGGSHGAWCWEPCIASLASLGHRAWAIDLPGGGADTTPRNCITIKSYAEAIQCALDQIDSDSVTLVGHSIAGVALAEAVVGHLDKVAGLVYVAAIVLQPGECAIDHVPEDRRPSYFELAKESADNSILLSYDVARRVFFNDFSQADAQKYYQKLKPQALSVYLDKATIDAAQVKCSKSYIACRMDKALGYEASLKFGERLGGAIIEINAGHDVMLSAPEELAKALDSQLMTK